MKGCVAARAVLALCDRREGVVLALEGMLQRQSRGCFPCLFGVSWLLCTRSALYSLRFRSAWVA